MTDDEFAARMRRSAELRERSIEALTLHEFEEANRLSDESVRLILECEEDIRREAERLKRQRERERASNRSLGRGLQRFRLRVGRADQGN